MAVDLLTQNALNKLIESSKDSFHVSIYIGTAKTGPETRKNRIKFKNLLDKSEKDLLSAGLSKTETFSLLEKAHDLEENLEYWNDQAGGLAVLLTKQNFSTFRLPTDFKENVIVGKEYFLKPLIGFLTSDNPFFILALSKNHTKLLFCTKQNCKELEPPGMPLNMEKSLDLDTISQDKQHFPGTSEGTRGQTSAVQFGHEPIDDIKKQLLTEYFSDVNRSLENYLKNEDKPMLIAAVDYYLPLYRKVNTYKGLINESIEGSPDDISNKELHDKGWEIVQKHFSNKVTAVKERYEELKSRGRTVSNIDTVVNAAFSGNIETLFVGGNKEQWGKYDPALGEVIKYTRQRPQSEDLFDLATKHTLLHKGSVYFIDAEKLPEKGSVAAILRY